MNSLIFLPHFLFLEFNSEESHFCVFACVCTLIKGNPWRLLCINSAWGENVVVDLTVYFTILKRDTYALG